jgi:hypothetical protein
MNEDGADRPGRMMEREISRLMRPQFIHLRAESQLPPFRTFESAVIVSWKEAEISISLLGVSLGARLRGL